MRAGLPQTRRIPNPLSFPPRAQRPFYPQRRDSTTQHPPPDGPTCGRGGGREGGGWRGPRLGVETKGGKARRFSDLEHPLCIQITFRRPPPLATRYAEPLGRAPVPFVTRHAFGASHATPRLHDLPQRVRTTAGIRKSTPSTAASAASPDSLRGLSGYSRERRSGMDGHFLHQRPSPSAADDMQATNPRLKRRQADRHARLGAIIGNSGNGERRGTNSRPLAAMYSQA